MDYSEMDNEMNAINNINAKTRKTLAQLNRLESSDSFHRMFTIRYSCACYVSMQNK